ncbi:MAG: Cys-tRNA(Pro) deacylase [Planctomycetota bacterium]|nr:Cys-tRNA(Pro) deacylase [Planctomycetota bacterium]
MKTAKTNAARLLDRAGVDYRLVSYRVDERDLGAIHLANELGEPPGRIFKTLALSGDKTGHFVCCLPGDLEVDLKKAAKASGNKSASLLPLKKLQAATGYVRGGCSPLAMKKRFPTFIHQSAEQFPAIYVSAGLRGLQILIDPRALAAVAGAVFADLA